MDKIQRVLIKEGKIELAQQWYLKQLQMRQAKMERYDVTAAEMKVTLDQIRQKYDIDPKRDAIYRAYMVVQDEKSNKFHYFTVFKDDQNVYIATNIYGRIGYPGKIHEIMKSTDKNEAMNAMMKKKRAKERKYTLIEEQKKASKLYSYVDIDEIEKTAKLI